MEKSKEDEEARRTSSDDPSNSSRTVGPSSGSSSASSSSSSYRRREEFLSSMYSAFPQIPGTAAGAGIGRAIGPLGGRMVSTSPFLMNRPTQQSRPPQSQSLLSPSTTGSPQLLPVGVCDADVSSSASTSNPIPHNPSLSGGDQEEQHKHQGVIMLTHPPQSDTQLSSPTSITGTQHQTDSACAQVLGDDDEEMWFEQEDMHRVAFTGLEEIRREGKLCDVTLVVGEDRFTAHRLVLAATIPYFRSMFTCDMVEAQQPEINMQGIDPDTLEHLINFAYTARLRITVLNVQNVMVGASFLQLGTILEACCRFLQTRLQGSNVLNVRSFAMALGCRSLVKAADRFLQKHFSAVAKTEDFLTLSLEDMVDILSRDELFVSNEEQVFEAAMAWVKRDEGARRAHMASLLSCIRLPLLKPQYITDRVASDDLVRGCLRCRDLVDEAKDYHLMPERRPLLQTFRTKPRCCNDIPGIIYAVGGLTNSGDSLSTVEMYDPMVGRWSSIEPMTTLRSRVGVAVMDGLLYAIGGFNGHERLRTVELFNPENRRWKEVAPLNNKRSALGAAVAGGDRLYVCGGYDGITSLSTVECYDPSADRWILLNSMTKQRSAAGISVLDGKIYVMGGHDGMSIFNSVECYDPETQRWSPVKQMLNRRCRLGAATLNGRLYACGGYDGAQFLRTVECYDPGKDEWETVGSMNVKRSRVALVANCGKLYAIGGYDGISNLSSMEIYSPEENVWKFGASMMAHEGGVGIGVVPIIPKTDV